MNNFYIETYGCQMNKADSASIIHQLTENGFHQTHTVENADIILINTCSVRKTAENRIWGRLGFYKSLKKKQNLIVVLIGCMAQRLQDDIFTIDDTVDLVVGTFQKSNLANILKNYSRDKHTAYVTESLLKFGDSYPDAVQPFKAFITISHGCNNFCSYCIVPYVRGREVSRKSGEIIEDINRLVTQGVKQITLLGQNVNSYGNDNADISFPELLKLICRETDIKWIKFLSSHPKDFTESLIEVMAAEDKVANWVHLALQSGSNSILKAMNRKYTIESYIEKVRKLKENVPRVNLTTDIIVGFPGETHDNFLETYNVMKEIKFDDAYMYKYNSRENTMAFNQLSDDVPDEEKLERLSGIIDMQRGICRTNKAARSGDTFEVIAESFSKRKENEILGLTKEDLMIVFEGQQDDFNKILKVRATGLEGNTLYGKKI